MNGTFLVKMCEPRLIPATGANKRKSVDADVSRPSKFERYIETDSEYDSEEDWEKYNKMVTQKLVKVAVETGDAVETVRSTPADKWRNIFKKVCRFVEVHGRIPKRVDDDSLARWCERQKIGRAHV